MESDVRLTMQYALAEHTEKLSELVGIKAFPAKPKVDLCCRPSFLFRSQEIVGRQTVGIAEQPLSRSRCRRLAKKFSGARQEIMLATLLPARRPYVPSSLAYLANSMCQTHL